jgi:hypothetical protein
MRVSPTWPEGHAQADQKHCSQNQKECGLLDPRDRRHRQRQGETEKADWKRLKTESGEKSAKRQQYEKDETGRRRRQKLLNT